MPKIIKGSWLDRGEEVMASQQEPFVFICSNGSRWYGQEEGDITELIEVLGRAKLDVDRFGRFISENPKRGVKNPMWSPFSSLPQYVDGPPIFDVPVTHFWGNFEGLSHVFSIYTNDADTIEALTQAVNDNLARHAA